MAMNRRNVLIGLGTVAAGGGAVLGTGAFSTVEAERTVDMQTSGDSDAQVQLSISGGLAGSNGNDTISINEQDINADAITKYPGALEITIPQSTEGETYEVEIEDGNNNSLLSTSADEGDSGNDIQFIGSSAPLSFNTASSNDSESVDIVINTKGTNNGGTDLSVSTATIVVTDTS